MLSFIVMISYFLLCTHLVNFFLDKFLSFDIHLCRTSAEEAIQRMQGAVIGQQVVRLSWGRSPTAKQVSVINFLFYHTGLDWNVFFMDWIGYFFPLGCYFKQLIRQRTRTLIDPLRKQR